MFLIFLPSLVRGGKPIDKEERIISQQSPIFAPRMKYYLLAGEASGDLHAAYLMQALLLADPSAEFRFWGGDRMQAVGGQLVVHYKERAIMGFGEVFKKLPLLLSLIRQCKADIKDYQPDRLIFIDNSGFNLRIAPWAKAAGFNTHYYISPQVWASRASRVKTIKACIDQMYVVLPFVKAFYARYDYPVHYVGHPLLDVVADFRKDKNARTLEYAEQLGEQIASKETKIIALLPGSRRQEITTMLPIMLEAASQFPQYAYVIAAAPAQEATFYRTILAACPFHPPRCSLVLGQTYPLLEKAHAALVTSGTATLETALFKVPMVVAYKGDWLSYQIAKRLIKTKYISLVNLVLDEALVPERIQGDLTADTLAKSLKKILGGKGRSAQLEGFDRLVSALGNSGAAQRVATMIHAYSDPRNSLAESTAILP